MQVSKDICEVFFDEWGLRLNINMVVNICNSQTRSWQIVHLHYLHQELPFNYSKLLCLCDSVKIDHYPNCVCGMVLLVYTAISWQLMYHAYLFQIPG